MTLLSVVSQAPSWEYSTPPERGEASYLATNSLAPPASTKSNRLHHQERVKQQRAPKTAAVRSFIQTLRLSRKKYSETEELFH